MSEGTFQKMATSKRRMYGPKGLLICGFPPAEHAPLPDALDQIRFNHR